jgi:hypothetical protein
MTPEEIEALRIARELIKAGVPIFSAAPNPDKPGHYYLPPKWEQTVPAEVWLEKWRPGWALGAVGGHVADFLDFDPRNGGLESRRELEIQGQMPRAFGVQKTPSGGEHHVISLTGERKSTGFMPGLDLQSGSPEPDIFGKHGRGFVYIAPTVRPSKAPETMGELRAYEWVEAPDLELLEDFRGSDDTTEGIIARVHAKRTQLSTGVRTPAQSPDEGGSQLFMQPSAAAWGGERLFTRAEAEAYCVPALAELEKAQVGEIEECANRAAVMLAHFVPALWSADEAFGVLTYSLSKTAYDPNGPSDWTAEKFRPVLDGRRPPMDNWKAARKATAQEAAAAYGGTGGEAVTLPTSPEQAQSMVDALLAELLTPDQLGQREAPRALVKGLLNLDSEAWIIGAPGSKKSFVVLDLAAHIALGRPWQGLRVNQGLVVMIVAEGAGGMSTRVKAWQQENGPIGDQLLVLPRPVQASDIAAWQVLVEACRRLEPVMVVIDTQARVTVGMEENAAKDMGVYIEAVRRVREATGACVLTVHHTGRNGGDARGSSAIDGAQGTELKVVRQDTMTGVLKIEKQKDLEERPEVPLYFRRVVVGVDEDGDEVTSLVMTEGNAFKDAAGAERIDPADEWEAPVESVRELALRVLADHGEERGVTSSQAHKIVIERWYGRDKSRLKEATWRTSWNRAIKDESVLNVGGERYTIDPLIGQ